MITLINLNSKELMLSLVSVFTFQSMYCYEKNKAKEWVFAWLAVGMNESTLSEWCFVA